MFSLEGASAGTGAGGGGGDGSWKLTEVSTGGSGDDKALSIPGGTDVTAHELVNVHAKAAGERAGTFTFCWDGNTVEISSNGGLVSVTLNGGEPQPVSDPTNLHLELSPMACCIGDACVMWPKTKPALATAPPREVAAVDSHVHLCPPSFSKGNTWVQGEERFVKKVWTEADLVEDVARGGVVQLEAAVYVECGNSPAIDEATWALGLADSTDSKVAAVVAHIEVQKGPEAARSFVCSLLEARGWGGEGDVAAAAALHMPRLRGGRVVLPGQIGTFGDDEKRLYGAGVGELGKMGLHYELCCRPGELSVSRGIFIFLPFFLSSFFRFFLSSFLRFFVFN